MKLIIAALTALTLTASPGASQTFETSAGPVKVERVVSGLENPWAFAFLPSGDLIITERPGRLRLFSEGRLSGPTEGLPDIRASGQGGLLDVAIAPDFGTSGKIYLSYASPVGFRSAQTRVSSARLDGLMLKDVTTVFTQEPAQSTSRHFGSRIVVADDASLFITVGDRGERPEAQNPATHQGSVIRVTADGAPHPDNPFVDGARGWRPEIFSYGHRNPQGAAIGDDGVLWTLSHGAKGGDEVNRVEAGKNYGWPAISYGRHYNGGRIGAGPRAPGMEQPVHFWDPSIAPSGLAIYEGDMFPEWRGDLFAGALKYQLISRLDMEGGRVVSEERLFKREFGRIRDVRVATDGAIWFATDSGDGGIYRISR